MKRRRDAALPARLEKARDRFEAWRKSREKRSAIPERLWRLAARLAQDFGVHPVAKALRVNYERLHRRVGTKAAKAQRPRRPRSQFVELPAGPPVFSPACVLELEKPSGAKMRISLQGVGDGDLVSLTSAFLSTER